MTDTLAHYILYRGDVAVGSRAFPEDAVQAPLRAQMTALNADSARMLGTITLPVGRDATAVEHDYQPDGTKVRVAVWRNDANIGLRRQRERA